MNREEIIRMAREAGFGGFLEPNWDLREELERFAALVAAAEREKLAAWMMAQGYATGHGDTVEDLLKELEWQIEERIKNEREACAKVCEELRDDWLRGLGRYEFMGEGADYCADAIRARGEK